jgi:predicted glycoside hydrolase/deacetylase ChbG (UPF0249 family)
MKERRIIVNADDFGMSKGITDAVLVAHRYGFLTSTSLMVNMPWAEYAVDQTARAPRLGVGIHLNICQGRPVLPVSEVRTLVDSDGVFHRPTVMIQKLWRREVEGTEIEAEFRAQISWMKQRSLHPTHADSHHHMHIYPAAVRPFVRAMKAEGIECVRASRFSCWPSRNRNRGYKEPMLLRLAARAYRTMLQATLLAKIESPESRLSFPAGNDCNGDDIRRRWMQAFALLGPGTYELACHPGLFDPDFSPADRIRTQREAELQCLTDPVLRAVLEQNKIRLISYRELGLGFVMSASAEKAVAS